VASTPEEDAPGLWERLRAEFPAEDIYTLDDEDGAFTKATAELLKREQRVAVHVQGTRQLRAVAELRRQNPERVKTVYTVHSFRNATWKRRPYCWVVSRELRANADYVLFLSPAAMQEFVNCESLIADGRGGLMPLGVENWADWRDQRPGAGDVPDELIAIAEQPDAFRFVYLAAFKPGKGHYWMVDGIAPALREQRNAHVIIAGWGLDSLRMQALERARELDIADQIHAPGAVRRDLVPWLLSHCQAAIVPSLSETFSQAIVEPMAAGLPVLGTRKGVGSYLIMDYHTGLGVNYDDRSALARAARYMITHPDEVAQMGRNAAELVIPLMNWDHVAACHLRLYAALFGQ